MAVSISLFGSAARRVRVDRKAPVCTLNGATCVHQRMPPWPAVLLRQQSQGSAPEFSWEPKKKHTIALDALIGVGSSGGGTGIEKDTDFYGLGSTQSVRQLKVANAVMCHLKLAIQRGGTRMGYCILRASTDDSTRCYRRP
jgi:hypothetical protein